MKKVGSGQLPEKSWIGWALVTEHCSLLTAYCLVASISQTRRMVSRCGSPRVRNSKP
jgi:hypothetical protein